MILINEILKLFEESFKKLNINLTPTILESNRPELSDFQCNDALILSKQMKKNPKEIAKEIVLNIKKNNIEKISIDGPGFINVTLKKDFIASLINKIKNDVNLGFLKNKTGEKIIVDYAGMNIAKIMHVGHLRSNIIGQALLNLGKYVGNEMIGDAHLGDWGTPMGVIIAEIYERNPELDFFNPNFKGNYEQVYFPYTVEQLISIYPIGSIKNKEDEKFQKIVQEYVLKLQNKIPGIYDMWKIIRKMSIEYFTKITDWLNVHLDYWYGESDANDSTRKLADNLKKQGILKLSEGAMVIEIPQLYKKNMPPPFIMYKSNGALKYEATDLGTICNRVEQFHPNKIFYVIDKRQELSMFLVFNAANNIKLFKIEDCEFIGFGTINGVDGKPLKTRNGNAATLQTTINETYEAALKIISNNKNANYDKEQIKTIAYYVALSSLKFADLSNSFSTDYIYDVEKFTQFEGKTGPYILYTAVRIKSILKTNSSFQDFNIIITNDFEKNIIINLSKYSTIISECWKKRNLSILCNYIYELCSSFNIFYHNCPVNNASSFEEKEKKYSSEEVKNSRLIICKMVLNAIENFASIIGIFIPEKM